MGVTLVFLAAAVGTLYFSYKAYADKSTAVSQQTGAQSGPAGSGGTPNYASQLQSFINGGAPSAGVPMPGTGTIAAGVGIGAASTGLSLGSQVTQNGLTAASAIPIAGAAVGVIAGILGAISAHHKAAVKAEAQHLNDAVPHFNQGLALIIQGAATKQLTLSQCNAALDQLITDYYTMVMPSLNMDNKEKGIPAMRAADVKLVRVDSGGELSGYKNTTKLKVCNGPCTVALSWLEVRLQRTRDICAASLKGQHGTVTFSEIGNHAGFSGAPGFTVQY